MFRYFCKQNAFDGGNKLECLRTTEPVFRTYEPSDYRTFRTESSKSRYRTYEPSDCRTFGMKNPLFRTYEPSDYRTFGLESSHHDTQCHEWTPFGIVTIVKAHAQQRRGNGPRTRVGDGSTPIDQFPNPNGTAAS